MAGNNAQSIFTPDVWFLVFKRNTSLWWLRWLPIGRFKHVFALGWVSEAKVWLVYEICFDRTIIGIMPDGDEANAAISALREDAVTLSVAVRPARKRWFPFAFWCTPAVASLVGLPCALRPDSLFKHCLRNDAVEVD